MEKYSISNPFRRFLCEGVVGSVPDDFDSITLISRGDVSVSVFVGQLCPGCYDFGYQISPGDIRNLPGEGRAYFKKRSEALLYGLYQLRIDAGPDLKREIDSQINNIMARPLFDDLAES